MYKRKQIVILLLTVFLLMFASSMFAKKKDKAGSDTGEITGTPVLWRDPGDISARNLLYGPGGQEHAPHGAMTFVKEDLNGTNPKLDVKDESGVKWKVKMGAEAKPEPVADHLLWAVGYFANEDYYLPEVEVKGLPEHLHRGGKWVTGDVVHNVRLKRSTEGEKKIGNWEWKNNPFMGTREFNGLRTMMAVLNNWDLKDINNVIYREKHPEDGSGPALVYLITDLGASFGTTNFVRSHEKGKGNLESYEKSKFIRKVDGDFVDFDNPKRPEAIIAVNPKEFRSRVDLEWIGRHIPRADAKWIGSELAKLSPQQIRDAFRAGGYSPEEVEGFARVVESRIAQLNQL
jgi:hypothetical protein